MNTPRDILNNLLQKGFEFFGRYYSFYDAVVVDNNDPDKLMRVQFNCQELEINNEFWAHPIGVINGNNSGVVSPPPIGSNIQIMFKYGLPRNPYYIFGRPLLNKTIDEASGNYPNVHIFKSPSGLIIKLDDKEDNISIMNATGKTIDITKEGISLGNLDRSSSPIVLGDKNLDALTKTHTILSNLNTSLINFSQQQSVAASSNPATAGLVAGFTQLSIELTNEIVNLTELITTINQTNSTQNTTE